MNALKAFGVPYFTLCFALIGAIVGIAFAVEKAEGRLRDQRVALMSGDLQAMDAKVKDVCLRQIAIAEALRLTDEVKAEDGEPVD